MKKIFVFFLFLCSTAASAQDCDKEQLKTLPGTWLPQPRDEVQSGTPKPSAADAAGAKTVFTKIGKLFREQYKPVGADVYNYLTHNISPGSAYGNWYMYTISNFRFVCINGKRAKNSEGVSSSIHINPAGAITFKFSEMPLYDESGKVSSEVENSGGFNSLSSREIKNGKLPNLSKGYHTVESGNDYYVWITHEGKMPFRYVSRKEFLEKQVAIAEAKLKETNAYYNSKSWKEQLAMFPQNKEKMQEAMKKHLSMYEGPLESYRQDLKKEATWLNEMAVVKQESVSGVYRFVFTTLTDPYMSAVPIMPNPAYYNSKLPKWAPQFMVINVGRTDGFIGENIRKVVDNNIDFFKNILVNQ